MKARFITGILLMTVAALSIYFGGGFFFLFITLAGSLALWELLAMSAGSLPVVSRGMAVLALWFLLLFSQVYGGFFWGASSIKAMVFFAVFFFLHELFHRTILGKGRPWVLLLRAWMLLAMVLPFFLLIRSLPNGMIWMFFVVLVIAASDTVALFGGKFFGKTPLSAMSPNKTVEGSIFAILGSVLMVFLFRDILAFTMVEVLMLGSFISVLAQLGDLHESLSKRVFGVKDSSQLLPGHGGFYDRLDSYVFVLPVLYYGVLLS